MIDAEGKARLRADAADMLMHLKSGAIDRAREIMKAPTTLYTDAAMFEREIRHVFRRLPLILAASCELARPGDYKSIAVAGIPVLMVRGKDGVARAFLNACTHRGSKIAEGCGHAARFTCPYHGWTFGPDGALVGVASRDIFGELDSGALGLKALPLHEQAGLIWVILDPGAPADFSAFVGGIAAVLQGYDLQNWHLFESRTLDGANWKLAFDAHLEFYHVPVLHRATFGAESSNMAQYYFYGPHQRLGSVSKAAPIPGRIDLHALAGIAPEEWPVEPMMFGEWVVFPNVSINSFYKGGRGLIMSQIFPGKNVGESVTIQTYLHEKVPVGDDRAKSADLTAFLAHVVGTEDLPLSRGQQEVFASGLLKNVHFGRNERGLQHFHRWMAHCLASDNGQTLAELMATAPEIP